MSDPSSDPPNHVNRWFLTRGDQRTDFVLDSGADTDLRPRPRHGNGIARAAAQLVSTLQDITHDSRWLVTPTGVQESDGQKRSLSLF